MNTKSFNLGFTLVDKLITSASTTKRGIVNAVKVTGNGALSTSEAVTSFFAGAKQAIKCRGNARITNEEQGAKS